MHVYDIATNTWAAPIDMTTVAKYPGLAFDPSAGLFYMVANPVPTTGDRLYTLDSTTFAATLVGPTGVSTLGGGLAFSSVPEPSLAAGLLFAAVLWLRRSRAWR